MSGKDTLLRDAGSALGKFWMSVEQLRREPTSSDRLPSPDDCDAAIESWRAKGVADDDRIFSYDFNQHPLATQNTIPFAEMATISVAYRELYGRYKIDYDLRQADSVLMRIREGYVKPDDSMVTPQMVAEFARLGDPVACQANVAAAHAIDPGMTVGNRRLTLDQFETDVCGQLETVVPAWVDAARAALRARHAQTMAPFAAAGIGGRKLDLMIEYADVYWRLPGGARTDDPATLAQASVLFHWLEAADRNDPRYAINTIRRFVFSDNDLIEVTERQYRRPKGASLDDGFA